MKKFALPLVVAALGVLAGSGANAQTYPSRPIRMIVPFPPGGGTDIMARVVAMRVSEAIGQSVVVDNRPGAGGTIGFETGVRASPDGYTLVVVNSNYSATAALQKLAYDPVNDVQPIVLFGETGLVVVVHPSMPVRSVKELIAHARANPAKLNYGSVGTGSLTHFAFELIKLETRIDLTHVPYKGGAPALNAVIGGEVQLTAIGVIATMPHLKAGRLRALAVTTAKRSNALPEVPAMSEIVPGYEANNWYGMWGPKGLPGNIVARWNREVAKVLQSDEMKGRLASEGLEAAGGPPEEFHKIIRRDVEKWRRVVKEMKITAS
jgi:tripartite-type tricarboxylate transporter receptor subunit TctC